MATKRVLVTGGSGKAGVWIIQHLLEQGYEVVNVDSRRPAVTACRTIVADLTQLGQVVTAFSPFGTGDRRPYDGVIHMAAIPRAHESPNDEIFRVNTLSTYNVLEACALLTGKVNPSDAGGFWSPSSIKNYDREFSMSNAALKMFAPEEPKGETKMDDQKVA